LKRKEDGKLAFPSAHLHVPFIDFFVAIIGHYKQAMHGSPYRFDTKRFVELAPEEHRAWLAAFVDCSQMLDMFAQEREVRLDIHKGPFDVAVAARVQPTSPTPILHSFSPFLPISPLSLHLLPRDPSFRPQGP
jgi:hypothetical protein